ncbi:MAG TPA: lactate utilization protein C [Bacillales bacterium]|nr:lactate utilization protein C [Bacillales bacterium]
MERERFLARVAAGLGRERRREAERPDWRGQPHQRLYADESAEALGDLFEEQCRFMKTEVKRTSRAELAEVLESTAAEYGGGPVVVSDDERYEAYGLGGFLQREGVSVWDDAKGRGMIELAERAKVGVSFADLALAESGTVVVFSRPGNGRTLHMLPENYIAIIPKGRLVPRFSQASRYIQENFIRKNGVPSCVKFISGPSNSADIELKSVVGVHGPVRAAFLLVEDA